MTDLHDTAEARAKLPDFTEAKTLDAYLDALLKLPKPEAPDAPAP